MGAGTPLLPWHSHVLTPSSLMCVTIQWCPGNPQAHPGKGPVGGHKATPQPSCAAGMRTPAEPWQWGLRAGQVKHSQAGGVGCWAAETWVPMGAGRAWQGGLGAARGCRPGIPCPGLRTCAWCSVPSDQCLVHSVFWFSRACGMHCSPPSPCLLPRTSVVPVLVPVSRVQCPVHGTQCLWMVLVAVLVSVPSPAVVTVHGGTAYCVVFTVPMLVLVSTAGAQFLIPVAAGGLVPRYLWPCRVPNASVQCPPPVAPFPCPVPSVLSGSGPSAP